VTAPRPLVAPVGPSVPAGLVVVATLAAAASLTPLFSSLAFWGPVIWLAVVGVAGCVAARAARLWLPLVPLVGLAAVIIGVTVGYARDVAPWGVWPGPAVWQRFQQLLAAAGSSIHHSTVPTQPTPALVALTAFGVGVVAVAADTAAVSLGSAALAGLPLLVLYGVGPVVHHGAVAWPYFVLAAAGWLGLLVVEGRLRAGAWGRRASTGPRRPGGDPLGALGRRVGAASLGLALVLPALVPLTPLRTHGGGTVAAGAGRGKAPATTVVSTSPLDSIRSALNRPTDSQLFTYTTTDPAPDYLRMVTLDTFTGTTWLPAKLVAAGPTDQLVQDPPEGIAGAPTSAYTTTTVRMGPLDNPWLPVPYPAVSVAVTPGQDWSYDATTRVVFSPGNVTSANLRYTVHAVHLAPTPAQLRGASGPLPAADLVLPRIPASVARLARQLTAGAPTAYDKAVALQAYFQSSAFTYSTDPLPVPAGQNPLVAFLASKSGFCQQYAGTYAVMARAVGLATRVDIGFTAGERVAAGQYSVGVMNTHAWPEVYFPGFGWERFEPTKSALGAASPSYAAPLSVSGPGSAAQSRLREQLRRLQAQQPSAPPPTPVASTPAPTTHRWLGPLVALLALVLVLGGLVPGLAGRVRRRGRLARAAQGGERGVLAAWAQVADTCGDVGWGWGPAVTPRQASQRVGRRLEQEDAAELAWLAGCVERARFADPAGALAPDEARLVTACRSVEAGVLAAVSVRTARRARWMPASVLLAGSDRADRVAAARPHRPGRPGRAVGVSS